jgi:hypothetical protein
VTVRRRLVGAAAALASVATLFALNAAPVLAAPARARADTIAMSVVDVSPSAPQANGKHALSVTLQLQNRTDRPLSGVRIDGVRGEPIESESALSHAVATTPQPSSSDVPFRPTHALLVDLPAEQTVRATFTTYTSQVDDHIGICICHSGAVYPLYFSAHAKGAGGVDQLLGVAATYLPTFLTTPEPVRVSWVWPLLEQPHRLTGTTVFTDDLLAGEVTTGGRLARSLDVVAQVAGRVPLTIVLDPETLDELEVMATGPYQVATTTGRTAPGTGKEAAAAWLGELHDVLAAHPDLHVVLTPYADPDVEALTRSGLTWTAALPTGMRARVEAALGGHPVDTSVAWPAGGALGSDTLGALARSGVSTVLLNSTDITPKPAAGAVPPGLARLRLQGRDVAVGLLSASLQRSVASAVSFGGTGSAALPPLIAQLGIRAAQEPRAEHVAVLAPPRYVDPSVSDAVRTIEATSSEVFARPISLADAVGGSLLPNARSSLARVPASAATLPDSTLSDARLVTTNVGLLHSLLDPSDPAVRTLLAGFPVGLQRAESAAWGSATAHTVESGYAHLLAQQTQSLLNGVKIIQLGSGSYTLASDNAKLPITVENDLPYAVKLMVEAHAAGGLPGFTAQPTEQRVEAKSKRTVQLPTKIARSGRIRIEAALLTTTGGQLGQPVGLTVHSTALGVIGLAITIGAGTVLALALLVRVIRRWRRRRRRPDATRPRFDPDTALAQPTPEPTG